MKTASPCPLSTRSRLTSNLSGALLSSVLLCGCVVVPVPVNYHTSRSRKNVSADELEWFVPGTTTRHEAVLRLGEPDDISADDARLTYRWEKVHLQLWIAAYGGGGCGEYGPNYALELSFDQDGRLKNSVVQKSKWQTQNSDSLAHP
jgi:hypothetical protein